MKFRVVWLASAGIVGALYYWIIGIGALPERFKFENQFERYYGSPPVNSLEGSDAVNAYYDLLARSFASGKLRLPVDPLPELLALPDPWKGTENWNVRLLDVALFQRHYYLYHGPTPVVFFFLPWYLATGRDLPENFAAFLIALLAFVVWSRLFSDILDALEIRLPLALYGLILIALGTGQTVPFLLHRAKMYEVAIACAQLCVGAGFYCAFRALTESRRATLWIACAGLSFGLAVGCRPHVGLAAIAASFLFAAFARVRSWRNLIAYIAPLALCGMLLMAYNYARFHSPFEFGTRYMLGDDRYRNFSPSVSNVVAGLYYLFLSPPRIEPEFPFIRLVLRDHLHLLSYTLPPGYFLERIAGALLLCPLILLAPLAPVFVKRLKNNSAVAALLAVMLTYAGACVLIIAMLPFSSQRYAVDFLPSLLFVSCVGAAVLLWLAPARIVRSITGGAIVLALVYAILANLGLAVQGPYDQFVQRDPQAFVALARTASPNVRYRPLLNPSLRAEATFDFATCPAQREALISAGELGSRYLLSAQCSGPGKLRLFSESAKRGPGDDPASVEVPFPPGPHKIGIDFAPKSLTMTVFWDEGPVLRQSLPYMVTSRSQIRYGWDATLGNVENFQGRITPTSPELGYLLK